MKKSLHVRIAKMHDGGSERIGATADLSELANVNDAPEKMTTLERDYKEMLVRVKNLRGNIDPFAKWKLADAIFSFLRKAEQSGLTVESHLKVLCRDTSISRTELKYLLKFRRTYRLDELDKKVSWSTYRSMLYAKTPYGKGKTRGNRRSS